MSTFVGFYCRDLNRDWATDASTKRELTDEMILTDAGGAIHAESPEMALNRQRHLLQGLSAEDVQGFTRCLRVFLENLETLPAEPGDQSP